MKTEVARLAESAVEFAAQGRWGEAVNLNRRIVHLAVDDVRARNRLGRALEALGRTAEAREAFAAALAIDPHDVIAARALDRLERHGAAEPVAKAVRRSGRPLEYGRMETRVEEPPGIQDEYLEPYEEYEAAEPERMIAERIELAGGLAEEARFEELEGAVSPELVEEERRQEERDRALATEEECDQR